MKRIVRVLIVAVLVTMIFVVAAAPAFARRTLGGTEVTTTACETVAGVAGFQWRSNKEVCWIQFPVQLPAARR